MTKKTEDSSGIAMGIAMLIGSIGMAALCLICFFLLIKCSNLSSSDDYCVDTIRVVVEDTTRYNHPIPVDSIVTKIIVCRMKVNDTTKVLDTLTCVVYDSIEVELPITQKKYEDSLFVAWVSGYKASLDSFIVYRNKEVQTITIHTKEQKKWNWGVSAGMGMVYNGNTWHCGPGITIGVSYNF